jgi:hypothetical protein
LKCCKCFASVHSNKPFLATNLLLY